jgi:hypothetical protein
MFTVDQKGIFLEASKIRQILRSCFVHPIGARSMPSDRIQGFRQKYAHIQDHNLMLHTADLHIACVQHSEPYHTIPLL